MVWCQRQGPLQSSPSVRRSTFGLTCVAVALLWVSGAGAQSATEDPQERQASLGFSQDLNLYQWLMNVQVPLRLANGVRFVFTEQFVSSLQRMTVGDKWKDDQSFAARVTYPLSSRLALRANLFSSIYRDQFSSLDNDNTVTGGLFGATFRPSSGVEIAPSVGRKWEERLGRADQGLALGLDVQAQNLELAGYHHRFRLGSALDRYAERQNEDFQIVYQVHRQFYTETYDTLRVIWSRLRRDSFVADPIGISVESLRRNTRQVENVLRYRISTSGVLRWRTRLSSNGVEIKRVVGGEATNRRGHDTFETENDGQLLIRGQRGFATFSIRFRSLSKKYSIPDSIRTSPFSRRFASIGYDIDGSTFSLSQRFGLRPGKRDSIGVFVSATRFRHDNSDSTNRDTHDEVRYHANLAVQHRLRPDLTLHWMASVYLDHFVYLDKKFSGSNNWTRIFRLSPSILYRPARTLAWRQGFEVRAQYVDFDFDELFGTRNSYVIREFIVTDSLGVQLSPRTKLNVEYQLELEELGGLIWDKWLEQPRSAWQNHSLRIGLSYQPSAGVLIAPGLTFFRQKRWRYVTRPGESPTKQVQGVHQNIGPTLRFVYRPRSTMALVLEGNSQRVNGFTGERFYVSHYNLSLNVQM